MWRFVEGGGGASLKVGTAWRRWVIVEVRGRGRRCVPESGRRWAKVGIRGRIWNRVARMSAGRGKGAALWDGSSGRGGDGKKIPESGGRWWSVPGRGRRWGIGEDRSRCWGAVFLGGAVLPGVAEGGGACPEGAAVGDTGRSFPLVGSCVPWRGGFPVNGLWWGKVAAEG